jgi:hypothetical protein
MASFWQQTTAGRKGSTLLRRSQAATTFSPPSSAQSPEGPGAPAQGVATQHGPAASPRGSFTARSQLHPRDEFAAEHRPPSARPALHRAELSNEAIRLTLAVLARRGSIGEYQLLAAIAAVHDEAPHLEDTDSAEILGLYDMLMHLPDNPMVTLNRGRNGDGVRPAKGTRPAGTARRRRAAARAPSARRGTRPLARARRRPDRCRGCGHRGGLDLAAPRARRTPVS